MNDKQLKDAWLEEEQHAFEGWDFSHLQSRWKRESLEWNYTALVMEHLHKSDQLLDMGTGGGEFLLSLGHPYENTSTTESWSPNIQLCLEKLSPLGIQVYSVHSDMQLPIEDDSFDVIINRHGSYHLDEVKRILKPGGIFITQQVGDTNCISLEKRINLSNTPARELFSLRTELLKLQNCGFLVHDAKECYSELKFFDVGAVVFWARIIVWSFPEFSVEKNFEQLCTLQQDILQRGFISTLEHRFFIVAQNII